MDVVGESRSRLQAAGGGNSLADSIAAAVDQGGLTGPASGLSSTPNAVTVVLNWPRILKEK